VINPFDLEIGRERREDLLREARERRIARALRKARRRSVREDGRAVLVEFEGGRRGPSGMFGALAMPLYRAFRR
jgi:hypothetical protein